MPIYVCRCSACGQVFETFARVAERDAIRCSCGGTATRLPTLPRTERRFAGSEAESLAEGFHPCEVLEARRLFPRHQHCIRDDGSVVFASRSEQRTYVARRRALEGPAKRPPPPVRRRRARRG